MTSQVTEVAIAPLKPDIDIESGELKNKLLAALKILSEVSGLQNVFYGRQVEHPELLQFSVDWESLDSINSFHTTPAFGSFKEHIDDLIAGPPNIVLFNRPSTSLFSESVSAPVAEMLTVYFPSDYPEAEFDKDYDQFKTVLYETAKGVKTIVGGWSGEEVTHKAFGEDGQEGKGKLFVGAIGWESIDAHMAFRETEGFPKAVGFLRKGVKSIEMHHVKFIKF